MRGSTIHSTTAILAARSSLLHRGTIISFEPAPEGYSATHDTLGIRIRKPSQEKTQPGDYWLVGMGPSETKNISTVYVCLPSANASQYEVVPLCKPALASRLGRDKPALGLFEMVVSPSASPSRPRKTIIIRASLATHCADCLFASCQRPSSLLQQKSATSSSPYRSSSG